MADYEKKIEEPTTTTDRGLFDFMGKKKEEEKKCEGEVIAAEFDEKVKVSEEKKEEPKLERSNSSSSSSSEEEVEEDGEKKMRKKKKGVKKGEEIDTNVPIEKCEDEKTSQETEEKKGFLDKIKGKFPGGKKAEDMASPPPTPAPAADCATSPGGDKEKKGFMEKIKEKIPGFSKGDEEIKDKEKEGACN